MQRKNSHFCETWAVSQPQTTHPRANLPGTVQSGLSQVPAYMHSFSDIRWDKGIPYSKWRPQPVISELKDSRTMCSWHESRWWQRQGMLPDSRRAISQNWRKELKAKACHLTFSMGWSSLLPKRNRQKWSRVEGGEETVMGRGQWACDPNDFAVHYTILYTGKKNTGKLCA